MERLQKDSPTQVLTEEQRKEIAEIDSLYRARIAERELLLKEQIQKETAAGKFAEVEQLQQQLATELRRLQEEREEKKDQVRKQAR